MHNSPPTPTFLLHLPRIDPPHREIGNIATHGRLGKVQHLQLVASLGVE